MSSMAGEQSLGALFFDVHPRTAPGFKQEVNRDLAAAGRSSGDTFGKEHAKASRTPILAGAKGAAVAAGGLLVAVGVGKFIGEALGGARDSIRVQKETERVIKTTGGAANVTAGHVGTLATKLSHYAAVDDDVIADGVNMLLTFKNIKNTKVDDTFDQAARAAVDMAAKFNGGKVTAEGLQTAEIQLGKALDNPIQGMGSLSRIGIKFNDQQKEQIKTAVKNGDTQKAQGIILKEVQSQVAGAAGASATAWGRLQVKLGNIAEEVGKKLVPVIDKLATWVTTKLIPGVERFWKEHGPKFRAVLASVGNFITTKVVPAIKDIWHWVQEKAVPAFKDAIGYFQRTVKPELTNLSKKFKENESTIKGVTKFIGDLIKFIVTKVVPVLIKLYAHYLKNLIATFGTLVSAIGKTERFLNSVKGAVDRAGKGIHDALASWFDKLPGRIGRAINDVILLINGLGDRIERFAKDNFSISFSIPNIPLIRMGKVQQGRGHTGDPRAFQSGGLIPGPAMGDRYPIMTEGGEFVTRSSIVKALGQRFFGFLNSLPIEQARNLGRQLKSPRGYDIAGDPGRTILGAGRLGYPDRQGMLLGFAAGGAVPGQGLIPRVQSWIRAQDPKPYVWAAAGPNAFDCSGIASAVYGMLTGKGGGSGQRYFTTSSIGPSQGFRPGKGTFTIGTTAGMGHMAGNLAGLGFEARGSKTGIFTGSAARSVTSFARQFYLPQMGGNFIGGGGGGPSWFDLVGRLASSIINPVLDRIIGAGGGGVLGKIFKGMAKKFTGAATDHLKDRAGFERGGPVWSTGPIYAHSGEGVLSRRGMVTVGGASGLAALNSGAGYSPTYVIDARGASKGVDILILEAIERHDREMVMARTVRPRR